MSKYIRFSAVLLFGCFSLSLLGCNELPKELSESNQSFEGHLIAGSFPGNVQVSPNERFEIHVVPSEGPKSLLIQAINIQREVLFEGKISIKKFQGLLLDLPYEKESYLLKKSSLNINRPGLSHCFNGQKQLSVSLCLGARDFSLLIAEPTGKTKLQIHGGLTSHEEFKLEEPRELTLTMAVDRALKKNFQSQYDFETTIQAHNTSMAALLNLMPHFRFINAVGIYTMAMPVLISSIGDWAPFLVPSRWFKRVENLNQDYASRLGFQVLQANLAQQIQMLALVLKHDQARLNHLKNTMSTVDEFLSLIKKGGLEIEVTPAILSIESYRESLDLAESQMKAVIYGDRTALSIALGYFNPQTVKDIQIDVPFLPIQDSKVYVGSQLASNAIDASLELQQLQFVKDSIRIKKASLALNWLDPSGSPDTGLGFNLIPQFNNIRSEIRQIEFKADVVRQQIYQVTQLIEIATARAKVNYKEISDILFSESKKTQNLLSRVHQELRSELKNTSILEISVNEILKSIKTVLELKFEQETVILNWEFGQVREERLLFMQKPRFLLDHSFR